MPAPTDQIADTLGFTLEELALNRAGKMSSHQVAESVKNALGASGLVITMVGLTLVVLFLGRPTGVIRVMSTVICLGLIALFTMFAWQAARDAVSHEVLVAEGPLEFRSGHRQGSMVVVGAFRSTVDNAHKALAAGERYRVYYRANTGDLLSIEPLAASPSEPVAPPGSGSGSGGRGP
jgi:hypothetical protein